MVSYNLLIQSTENLIWEWSFTATKSVDLSEGDRWFSVNEE